MKIRLSYSINVTEERTVTPEFYCHARANFDKFKLPESAHNVKLDVISGEDELENFLWRKR